MKYKVGDKVKVRSNLHTSSNYGGFDFVESMVKHKGRIATVVFVSNDDECYELDIDSRWHNWTDEMLEPVMFTIPKINKKKDTYCVTVRSKSEASVVDTYFNQKGNLEDLYDYWRETPKYDGAVSFWIQNGEYVEFCHPQYYKDRPEKYGKVYEFSDLFPVGSIIMGNDCTCKCTEVGIEKYKITETPLMSISFVNGSSITALPKATDSVRGNNHFNAFSNNGISAKNGGENSMKFTFYVTEGTRVDKSCNGTIPTMTTNIELLGGNVFDNVTTIKGSATCDKADYDERQGVLEALANAICGGNFYKAYAEAVKLNRCEDELSRSCIYCGKVLDTVEEKQAHEAWHVERRKARHERYLLRKRAKEIAFEEQAQKMAKEMMGEQK